MLKRIAVVSILAFVILGFVASPAFAGDGFKNCVGAGQLGVIGDYGIFRINVVASGEGGAARGTVYMYWPKSETTFEMTVDSVKVYLEEYDWCILHGWGSFDGSEEVECLVYVYPHKNSMELKTDGSGKVLIVNHGSLQLNAKPLPPATS